MNAVSSTRNHNGEDAHAPDDPGAAHQRKMVADMCRFLGEQFVGKKARRQPSLDSLEQSADEHYLPPRVRQTLDRILAGDSEKQIALRLGISRHTVHVYIKTLYRRYAVSSRGELVARVIGTYDSRH